MAFKPRLTDRKRIHAYVATPAYDGKVHSEFALSLAQAMQAATVHGINVTASVMGNGAFIDLARNAYVRMFLQTDCTHLFFIDSDLEFEPRAFCGLLTSGHPVAAGAYRRRQEPEDYPIRWVNHPTEGGLWVEKEWLMCDRVPTGFLCIERSVIEEMVKDSIILNLPGANEAGTPRLFYTKLTEDNAFMGEDFAWCEDYKKKFDRPIHVWPDFDFKHGGYKCNFYQWLTKQIEAESNGEVKVAQAPEGGLMAVDTNNQSSAA
jgi:hypothetical protein